MSEADWTTIRVRVETVEKLKKIRKMFREKYGFNPSMEEIVAFLLKFYDEHAEEQGNEEAPTLMAGA